MELNFNKRFASAHFHDFEEVSELYRSNSGAVHKAKFKFDKRWYVLKERNLAELGNIKANRRAVMMHEVNLLQQLCHPNVIKCEGWFWDNSRRRNVRGENDNGSLFIVLEYLDGGDLHKKIDLHRLRKHHFSERYIWYIFHQICSAVCHLHENGIVHRDLKTLNIILTNNDTIVKVADLGVSRQVSEDTVMLKTFYGTPLYLSPELVDSAQYNEKTDIWSLGIILYELAALRPPFQAKTFIGLANAIRKGEYEPINQMYSKQMQRCIQWLLHLDHKKRPSIRQVVSEVSKRLTSGYYGIEDWNKSSNLQETLSRTILQERNGDQNGDNGDDTDIEEDEESLDAVTSVPPNVDSANVIKAEGLVGNMARLLGQEKGEELEKEKDVKVEKQWNERKQENIVYVPNGAIRKNEPVPPSFRPSATPTKTSMDKQLPQTSSLPVPILPIPNQPERALSSNMDMHRPVTVIDGHVRDTARLRQKRERLRREREVLREKERIEREQEKKAKRERQNLMYEELQAQEKEKKERLANERAMEVKIAQEVKPLVDDKKYREGKENKVGTLSSRYNKDRERDFAKIAVKPPHPEVISSGVQKKTEEKKSVNRNDYMDAMGFDRVKKSRDTRKERLHYNGSEKVYFAREHRRHMNSPSNQNKEGSSQGLQASGVQHDEGAEVRVGNESNPIVKTQPELDDQMIRLDSQRLYTILRREMLRLKRLQQLQQLLGNGAGRDADNKGLSEKISEASIIIASIRKAIDTGYLNKSLAIKLGLKVDLVHHDASDKVIDAESLATQRDIDDCRTSRLQRDHVIVGDGWVPPVERNVIELEFNQKLPPKLSKDPFRHQIQLHSLFANHNDKTPGSSPVRPATAKAANRRSCSSASLGFDLQYGEQELEKDARQRPTTAHPVREYTRSAPAQSKKTGVEARRSRAGFNIISGAQF